MLNIAADPHELSFMLSRIQFALNISFHMLFPTINIALCWMLLFFKVRFNQTQDETWMRIYRFWVRIFALTFAIGVVTGITMSFQFGTNWPGYMETVGNVAGPLLGYEVLTAFFLEASFLSIMLFGGDRVSQRTHTIATLLVAIGTSMSAFWIISLNSWMQTPQGYEMIDGVAYVTSWWEVIFNPSMPYRVTHMLLASGLTASFFVAGVSAYRVYKGDNKSSAKIALKFAVTVAAIIIPLQIFVGDLHGLNTLEHQPAKVAAMEGAWHTEKGLPLLLFAIPDEKAEKNHFEVAIPNLASLILTHDLNGEVRGLEEFKNEHPPVAPVFFSFRIMIAVGLLMLLTAWLGCYFFIYKKQFPVWLLRSTIVMTFSGWIATTAGWYVTEIGRQPYLVTGLLRTKDAVTTTPPENVVISLTIYAVVYAFLFFAYVSTLFVMAHRAIKLEQIDLALSDMQDDHLLDEPDHLLDKESNSPDKENNTQTRTTP